MKLWTETVNAWAVPAAFIAIAMLGLPGDLTAQANARQVQNVKDFVEIEGSSSIELRGYGVVAGLNGNGDSPGGDTERMIRNFLASGTNHPIGDLKSKNVAGVIVTATLDPFKKKGTRFNVRISTIGDAKSLKGGTLLMTPLRGILPVTHKSGRGKIIYGVAQGKLLVEGDVRTGNPTSGLVPGGAMVKKELERKILKKSSDGHYVTLILSKPDYNVAGTITNELNTVLFRYIEAKTRTPRSLKVARTVDAGSIDVFIPSKAVWEKTVGTKYPEFDTEPVLFLDRVLNVKIPVLTVPRKAVVTINDSTMAVAWTAEVIVRQGRVQVGNLTVGSEERPSTLGTILDAAVQLGATKQELVDIVRELHNAGLLEAEVRTR